MKTLWIHNIVVKHLGCICDAFVKQISLWIHKFQCEFTNIRCEFTNLRYEFTNLSMNSQILEFMKHLWANFHKFRCEFTNLEFVKDLWIKNGLLKLMWSICDGFVMSLWCEFTKKTFFFGCKKKKTYFCPENPAIIIPVLLCCYEFNFLRRTHNLWVLLSGPSTYQASYSELATHTPMIIFSKPEPPKPPNTGFTGSRHWRVVTQRKKGAPTWMVHHNLSHACTCT